MIAGESEKYLRISAILGAAPLLVLGVACILGGEEGPLLRSMFDYYSMALLAFMAGGVWLIGLRGEGPATPSRLLWASIVCLILAWTAPGLPPGLRSLTLAAAFLFFYGLDRFVLEDYWRADYQQMRCHLTLCAAVMQALVMIA
ncbi:DUF3429 family protein [Hahella sp. KA22]|uniref:DUF3429 domain-containing protein n=1 Tax=Hahella sp. KA22 TaxID=1628392 RepID=UPI000FDF1C8F|nr:DUF3429 domain-containing protein [Hahella sp. KA22]AZZ94981.1 DUF3429 domain-containing protein [Hahella sp. KA22]QAY52626.1 DUF3429 family protein [Hahella sp. KA22]